MPERRVTLSELALVAGTRVVLGAGLGLLFTRRRIDDQCRAAGWALLVMEALSTNPLVIEVLGKREAHPAQEPCSVIGSAGTVNVPGEA